MDSKAKPNLWLEKITPYSPGKTIEGKLKLASNENSYGPSPKVIKVLKEKAKDIFRYPYKDTQVSEKIAGYTGVSADCILVGNGSDELIELILQAFPGPCIGFNPSFSQYKIYSQIFDIPYKSVDLNEDFSFNKTSYIEAAADANILFLCSPNNPTGMSLEIEDIQDVLELGKLTVVDEAYFEFSGKTSQIYLDEYPNLIILRTFAKSFALAGLRVGYAIATPDIINALRKVRAPFSVNLLAQEAALAALDDVDYMKDCVGKINEDKAKISEALSNKFKVFPSDSNFILVDVSPKSSDEVYQYFLDNDIIIRNFKQIPGFPGEYVRITIGTRRENEIILSIIEKI